MTVNVYKWPPVAAIGREWDVVAPINVSRSLITGAEFVSATQRVRRVATIEVTSRFSPYQSGMGYVKVLKRLLMGGVNLVRLDYSQFNWSCLDVTQNERAGGFFEWSYPAEPFEWTAPPAPFRWFTGTDLPFTISTSFGFPAIVVEGLPPLSLVVLPGEYVTVFMDDEDLYGTAYLVMTPASTDADGRVVIKLIDTPISGVRVSIGGKDTGVFKALGMPRSMEPASGDWSYTWGFEEVFEDEGRGPFVEINPWI